MKTKLFVIAIMVVILVTCLCLPVFAYADTSSDIVNFNQLSNWYSLSNSYYNFGSVNSNGFATISLTNTSVTWARMTLSSGTVSTSDKIYFRVSTSIDTTINMYGGSSGASIGNYSNNSSLITTGYTKYQFALSNYFAANSSSSISFRAIMINLTTMYGSGSEPTLSECNEIFVADYYAYNTGTPMYSDSINAYAKGVSDTLASFNITYNNYAIGSGSFAYSNTTIEKGVFAYGETENMYYWSGVLSIYLGGTIYKGTNFVVDFYLYCPDTSGESDSYKLSKTLQFGYVDSNNNLVEVVSITPTFSGTYFTYTGSFILPVDSDTIYCWVDYSTTSNSYDLSYWFAVTTSLEFQSFNVDSLLKAQKESIFELYHEYYGINGEGYSAIYDLGYTAGLNDTNPYTFGYLMSSVVEAPLNAILGIFNFEFLGVNFKNMITLVITLCVIIAIVRLFMGGD